jgi:hypothetical protein
MRVLCLLIILFTYARPTVDAQVSAVPAASESLENALSYANRSPMQRSRDSAVSMLVSEVAKTNDPLEKAKIWRIIGQLDYQSFDERSESPKVEEAIAAYKHSIECYGNTQNLEERKSEIELAAILSETGKEEDAKLLLTELIYRKVEDIYAAELTPNVITRLSVMDPRDCANPDIRQFIVSKRVDVLKNQIMSVYQSQMDESVRILCKIVFRQSGLIGLKDELEKSKGNIDAWVSFKTILGEYIRDH